MAKRKKPSRQSRWASDAALQATVRFGPEESGLRELLRQADEQKQQSIAQAHGGAAGLMNAIDQARPQVKSIYDEAGAAQAATASLAGRGVAGLSGVADPIRAAMLTEQTQGTRHLREEGAAALSGLARQRVQARSGEQFAVQSAQSRFVQDVAKVLARKQDLAGERGAFEASTAGALEQSYLERALSRRNALTSSRTQIKTSRISQQGQNRRAKTAATAAANRQAATLGQQERNSLRSSGINPDTGKPIPGGKLDPKANPAKVKLPGGAKLNSPGMHGTLKDQVESLRSWIRDNKADPDYRGPNGRHVLAQDLLQGVPASTITDDKTGEKTKDPGVPKASSQLALSMALDLELDRHVSGHNVNELHRRGYAAGRLGYPTKPGARRPKRRKPKPRRGAPSGTAVGRALGSR